MSRETTRTLSPPPSSAAYEPGEATTDVRAERGLRVAGRDQTVLSGMLGVHVVECMCSHQIAKLAAHALECTFWALARPRGVLVESSQARDLATALGRRPRPLGMHLAPVHPPRLAPTPVARYTCSSLTFYK